MFELYQGLLPKPEKFMLDRGNAEWVIHPAADDDEAAV